MSAKRMMYQAWPHSDLDHHIENVECAGQGCMPVPSLRPSALGDVAFGIGVEAVVVAAVLGIGWLYGRALERDLSDGDDK